MCCWPVYRYAQTCCILQLYPPTGPKPTYSSQAQSYLQQPGPKLLIAISATRPKAAYCCFDIRYQAKSCLQYVLLLCLSLGPKRLIVVATSSTRSKSCLHNLCSVWFQTSDCLMQLALLCPALSTKLLLLHVVVQRC